MTTEKKFRIRTLISGWVRKTRVLKYRLKGYQIAYSASIEGGVMLDKLNPTGINIGDNTLVARGAVILSHHHHKRTPSNNPILCNTFIGKNSLIGINSIIMPGIKVGDEVIVGAGAVVTKDVRSNCVVAGNPGRVIEEGIKMNEFAALCQQNTVDERV